MNMAIKSPDTAEIERLRRIQPYIARMGQSVGFLWYQLGTEGRSAVMELVNGSTGLDEKIIEWAAEFDEMWEARGKILNNDEVGDFHDQLANFTDAKIKALVVEARLS